MFDNLVNIDKEFVRVKCLSGQDIKFSFTMNETEELSGQNIIEAGVYAVKADGFHKVNFIEKSDNPGKYDIKIDDQMSNEDILFNAFIFFS